MKSNNQPLPIDHPVLKELLDKYPYFLTQSSESIHYKYNNTLATALDMLNHDTRIVSLSGVLERPLHIWRYQTEPYKYTIHYTVKLDDIKRVALYREGEDSKNILLKEEVFNKGVIQCTGSVNLESREVIPVARFFIEVETYDGLIFQKGFPENDTVKDDIYDHDQALDTIGRLYHLPRREYNTPLDPSDYPDTFPLFCDSLMEWDYYYQKRLFNYIFQLGKVPLHSLMLESIFGITPTVTGRWRYVARMGVDTMEEYETAKYMASTNWNSNVYDITYDLKDLPRNLKIPNSWDIHNLLNKIFPIGSKLFFKITEENDIKTKIGVKDELMIEIDIEDHIKITDNVTATNALMVWQVLE